MNTGVEDDGQHRHMPPLQPGRQPTTLPGIPPHALHAPTPVGLLR